MRWIEQSVCMRALKWFGLAGETRRWGILTPQGAQLTAHVPPMTPKHGQGRAGPEEAV